MTVLSVLTLQKYFVASYVSATMFVHSLPMKSRERLAQDVVDPCATHDGLVHDDTNTESQTQNGSAHGLIFATFKRLLLITRPLTDEGKKPP